MLLLLLLLLDLVLIGVMLQDFKSRSVHRWLLLLFIALSVTYSLFQLQPSVYLKSVAVNVVFLLFQILAVWVFYKFFKKESGQIVDTKIGKGDLYFIIGMALLFISPVFIPLFIFALIATLCLHFLFTRKTPSIPLAAYLAIPVGVVLNADYFFRIGLYEEDKVMNWFLAHTMMIK
jgi:hypothetical protein